MKKKMIIIICLAVVSVFIALFNFSNSKPNKKKDITIEKKAELKNKTESSLNIKEESLPNESAETENIIWIKNLNFLSSTQKYDVLMKLKTSLNTELKTLNKSIYEVNLLENTYEKKEKGFKIEAKADKLKGKILIDFNCYDFKYEIKYE